jgi:hypothetical protein
MQHSLRFVALLFLGFLLSLSQAAYASHVMGGDLTYRAVGVNQYVVTLTLYRDCSGATLPGSMSLAIQNGCAGGTLPGSPFNMSPVPNSISVGNFYCPSSQALAQCTPAAQLPNHEIQQYRTGTITISPGQWLLSTEICCRPTMANLVGQDNFRYEAMLDSRSGLQNSSPVFSNTVAYNLPWQQNTIFQMGAFDADGDSLVYSMEQPLNGCNTFVPYNNFMGIIMLSSAPTCIANIPPPLQYSATFPLPSFSFSGTCPTMTATPDFQFDPTSGSILANSFVYYPSSVPSDGQNKYVGVVKVNEYRRVNGTYTNIGSIRRELLFTVYNCGSNLMPNISPTVNVQYGTSNRTQPLSQIIPVHSAESIHVDLAATDANSGQTLNYTLAYNSVPGVTLQATSAGSTRLTFTPAASLPNGIYRVSVSVTDDACPIRGVETRSLAFRVYRTATATKANAGLAVAAYPNPFIEQVQFQLTKPGVQTLSICDQLGREVARVQSQASGQVQWQPGADLPAGLYLARTLDGSQTVRLLRSQLR